MTRISRVGSHLSTKAKAWILGASLAVVASAVAALFCPPGFALSAFGDGAQCVVVTAGLIALLPLVVKTRGRARLFWLLMTLGYAAWLVVQFAWFYYEVLLRAQIPSQYVGDIILFLHFVPMMAALALQPHLEPDERSLRLGSIDFILLLVWWLYLYLFIVIPWQFVSVNLPLYQSGFSALYLAEGLAFLGGLGLLWMRSKASWKVLYGNWFGAAVVYALACWLTDGAMARHVYYTGGMYDVPLMASMAWFAVVGVLSGELPLRTQRRAQAGTGHSVWAARLAMAAIISMPLLCLWAVYGGHAPLSVRTFRLLLSLGAMALLAALVFVKQHLSDRELMRLLRRSHASFDSLKALQDQLVQSEKLASLGQLVAGAAHELNNPLTAILGYTELLVATQPLTEQQRGLTEKISRQARRTKTLVSSLLNFAQEGPSEKALLNINSVVQTAAKLCQPHLSAKNITLELDVASELPNLLGDSNQLLQVCLHIMTNAMDALDEIGGGTIRVSTGLQDSQVVLEIADDGPGVRDPQRVFDPFYTTKPVGKGTGLGLSASYGIVREHRGRISCRDRSEKGAIFRIELPTLNAPSMAGAQPAPPGIAMAASAPLSS